MTHIPLKRELLACPFCGEIGLDFDEGSTFRWLLPSCKGCGATCGEVRVQTMGEGTPGEWRAAAEADAIDAWNRRSALYQPDTEQAEAVAWQWRERSPDPDDDNEWGGWRDVRSFDVEHIRRIVAARPDRREIRELYLHPPATPPSPSEEPAMPCGHHPSLMLHSAETGESLYCELCDDKSGRKDAELRETELAEANRDPEALNKLIATRAGYIPVLKATRAAQAGGGNHG